MWPSIAHVALVLGARDRARTRVPAPSWPFIATMGRWASFELAYASFMEGKRAGLDEQQQQQQEQSSSSGDGRQGLGVLLPGVCPPPEAATAGGNPRARVAWRKLRSYVMTIVKFKAAKRTRIREIELAIFGQDTQPCPEALELVGALFDRPPPPPRQLE